LIRQMSANPSLKLILQILSESHRNLCRPGILCAGDAYTSGREERLVGVARLAEV
jgi:hypothetical protein